MLFIIVEESRTIPTWRIDIFCQLFIYSLRIFKKFLNLVKKRTIPLVRIFKKKVGRSQLLNLAFLQKVKENQEKDKIGLKPDKNEKRGEAGKSLKQLQLKEEEKLKKTKKELSKTHTRKKQSAFFSYTSKSSAE
nr:hypothetical protein [Tanacetum cinerariifolium]